MKLTVLGSGSAGNCYLLHNEKECLVLEAGVSFMEVKKALDFDIGKIAGAVVSHEHGDHAKYIGEYAKAGISYLAPYGGDGYARSADFGKFHVKSFEVEHDVPCYGFLICHEEIGRLLFVTDTMYIRYCFKRLNHILIECNYGKNLISEKYSRSMKERIWMSHMEFGTCKDFIRANNNDALKTVCLLHLSDSNSNERMFQAGINEIVECPVYVASKGLEIELKEGGTS